MAKPRKCPSCENGVIKNYNASSCWNCYNKYFRKEKQYNVSQHTGKGEKHPRWKGGKWLYWRKQALIRDNYTCRQCGLYDLEIMDVDHIEPIKCTLRERREIERETDIQLHGIDNLQTLCPNCHKRKTIKQLKANPVHLKSR
jgi:5-methylcytosine-specific restriction endonuclease McrA